MKYTYYKLVELFDEQWLRGDNFKVGLFVQDQDFTVQTFWKRKIETYTVSVGFWSISNYAQKCRHAPQFAFTTQDGSAYSYERSSCLAYSKYVSSLVQDKLIVPFKKFIGHENTCGQLQMCVRDM